MDLDLTRIFVKVVQNNSFSKAAELLKVPKSTVSKGITRLEAMTGTKLLVRTTRSLTLTAAGRVFYETCLGPIQILEDAQKSLHGQDSIVAGLVKITAPEDLGTVYIAQVIARLMVKHPGLNFELRYTDEIVDLVKDGFDLAVRIGKLNESSFKVKRVGEIGLGLVAAPKYLQARKKISRPQDLGDHDCITYSEQPFYSKWTLRAGKSTATVPIKARAASNQMTTLVRIALAGSGVAFVPLYLCSAELESGKLVRVLPEWSAPGLPVSIISPLSAASSARLKVTSEEIFAVLREALLP